MCFDIVLNTNINNWGKNDEYEKNYIINSNLDDSNFFIKYGKCGVV